MDEELICPICGAQTSVYMGNARKDRLCRLHANELKQNKIEKCDDCGEWHNTDVPCKCKSTITEMNDELKNCNDKTLKSIKNIEQTNISENIYNNIIVIDENNKSKCILCGRKTEGLLFCSSCYYKYKNKELLIKITNCINIELLDESYEGRFSCKDGHIVKSKSEVLIDNYLFENNILHAYERDLPYGRTEKEILRPDFYLPDYLGKGNHVYIEHWGYDENNIQYTKTKKFKMPIYQDLCNNKIITLICTHEKSDINKIDTALDRKLNKAFIKENEINFNE